MTVQTIYTDKWQAEHHRNRRCPIKCGVSSSAGKLIGVWFSETNIGGPAKGSRLIRCKQGLEGTCLHDLCDVFPIWSSLREDSASRIEDSNLFALFSGLWLRERTMNIIVQIVYMVAQAFKIRFSQKWTHHDCMILHVSDVSWKLFMLPGVRLTRYTEQIISRLSQDYWMIVVLLDIWILHVHYIIMVSTYLWYVFSPTA